MKTHRVQWIGVKSPKEDDRVVYRILMGLYNDDELETLDAVAEIVSPLIVQEEHTGRILNERNAGLSKSYQWGPRRGTFVQDVDEIDVARIFALADQAEFRDLENPDHDHRTPEVPWHYVDQVIYKILTEAHNGPDVYIVGAEHHATTQSLIRSLEERKHR